MAVSYRFRFSLDCKNGVNSAIENKIAGPGAWHQGNWSGAVLTACGTGPIFLGRDFQHTNIKSRVIFGMVR